MVLRADREGTKYVKDEKSTNSKIDTERSLAAAATLLPSKLEGKKIIKV